MHSLAKDERLYAKAETLRYFLKSIDTLFIPSIFNVDTWLIFIRE